jgi:hypothetical protein
LAVAVLSGLLLPRDYLTHPTIAETLTNKVKETLFNDDDKMTKARIIKGVQYASESLGISMLVGEHGLCEFVRGKKEGNNKNEGNDAFHRHQDFVWISESDMKDGRISEIRCDTQKLKYRTEDLDRNAFDRLSRVDRNHVKHRWWVPPHSERTACLVHFVKECMGHNSDPMEVMFPSATAKERSGKQENVSMWKRYIDQHRIDVSDLPVGMRHLHLDRQTKSMTGRKQGKTKATKTGGPTSIKTMNSARLSGEKRKKTDQGEEKDNEKKQEGGETELKRRHSRISRKAPKVSSGVACASKEGEVVVVSVDLQTDAENALKERYGRNVPEINRSGASYSKIGYVWKHRIVDQKVQSGNLSLEYPPSRLDESCISIPDNGGKGWSRSKDSKLALWWWIICNVPPARSRREWAEAKLGNNASAVVLHNTKMWCTMYRSVTGSIWVEYKGRKMALDHGYKKALHEIK